MGRYDYTPYNKSKITTFPDNIKPLVNEIYKQSELFISNHESESIINGFKNRIGRFLLDILDCNLTKLDVNKSLVAKWFDKLQAYDSKGSNYSSQAWKYIFKSVLISGFYEDDDLDFIKSYYLSNYERMQNVFCTVLPILRSTKSAKFFRIVEYPNGSKRMNFSLIEFDTDNSLIIDLLLESMRENNPYSLPRVYNLNFYKKFGTSIEYAQIQEINDLDVNLLIKSIAYFKPNGDKAKTKPTDLECRMFWRFVIEKQKRPQYWLGKGINFTYITNENFIENYLNGFRAVLLNTSEPVPDIDKWSVFPNGLEKKSATNKQSDFMTIDFTAIKDPNVRYYAKQWFWTESNSSFNNRVKDIRYLIAFLLFRDTFRQKNSNALQSVREDFDVNLDSSFVAEDIISYSSECRKTLSEVAVIARLKPIKLFLRYLKEQDLYTVEESCFEYLVQKGNITRKEEINPIPKADFEKLVCHLEEKSKNNDLHLLYYIIFCLNTLTPLRISSILDLKYDCLKETGARGIYKISGLVKTSYGDERDIQVSPKVKRLIEVAVLTTASTRMTAPKSVKEYLFISKGTKREYKVIPQRSYAAYIQRCCVNIGLSKYSPQNLRKTYMTTIVENAIAKNVSLFDLHALTDHANIDTTENYYVKEQLRNYLEATQGVELGNIPVKGEVLKTYEGSKADLVNDNCGYCGNTECNVVGTATCLMCKGFKTTPKFIPDFERCISLIDYKMFNTTSEEDREHLYAVKCLYVKYLEEMYLVGGEKDGNNTEQQ